MTTIPDIYDELTVVLPEPPADLVDRSTIERYIECPFQGVACEKGVVPTGSLAADSGNEGHDCYATMVYNYIASDGQEGLSELIHAAESAAQLSRPDVQPDVLDAVRAGMWQFARMLMYRPDGQRRNPADILRYQGGPGERTGQIAYDIIPGGPGRAAVRLTTELDLLMAADARDELAVTDWKTGRTNWTAAQVRAAFQFQFQAALLFEVYPDCNRVWTQVFSPRTGGSTGFVGFTRRDAQDCMARCGRALLIRQAAMENPAEAPCWPDAERCCQCPAVLHCPKASEPAPALCSDPQGFLVSFGVRHTQLDADEAALEAYTKVHGQLEAGGWVFGPKPPSGRAPTYGLREVKAKKRKTEAE